MSLNLIKLCVGADSLEDLANWQEKRIVERKRKKLPLELQHITRMTPKRKDELLDGGSLYWVIKGYVTVRQKLIDLRAVTREGKPHCAIVYEPELIPVVRRFHRPFQGWRYLLPSDAPRDIRDLKGGKNMPPELKAELAELGLL